MLNNSALIDKSRREYVEGSSNKLLKPLITSIVKELHIEISNWTTY